MIEENQTDCHYSLMMVSGVVLNIFQALPYVMLLIAMLFFIYAIIGMQVSNFVLLWLLIVPNFTHV